MMMPLAQQTKHPITTNKNLLQLSGYFIQAFPEMTKVEQQIALALYRSLAMAKPVSTELIANISVQKNSVIDKIIRSWPGVFFDDNENIIGFWGISIQQSPHRIIFKQHQVYAWCAWDTLFIPELINATALVNSVCPVTNKNIELQVSPTQVNANNNQDVVVSMLKPDLDNFNQDILANFCQFVFFFSNHNAGRKWCAEHPNTFLLSLADAFIVGKKMNAVRYNLTL